MPSLPEISLGTAALIIFGVCAGYMLLRGIVRTIVNVACLTLSAWVGFRVWQGAPEWFNSPSGLLATGLPIVAFLVTLLVLRKIIGFFRAPVPQSVADAAPKSGGQLAFRLLLTLIPATLLFLVAATCIHYAGSVAEIRASAVSGTDSPPSPGLAERLKDSVSATVPTKLMDWLDPLTTAPRVQLAKMIAANPEKPLEPVIDPSTGRPYPRAIIVDDPKLVNLAHEGRFSTLLRHPLLSEALKDPTVRRALGQ